MKKVEWYTEFVDLGYKPRADELTVLFYFEPAAIAIFYSFVIIWPKNVDK